MQETTDELAMKGVEPDIAADRFSDGEWARTSTRVPSEMELAIYVNSKELVTILCIPTKLNCLVLGFLYAH